MAYGLSDIVQQRRMIDESTGSETFKRVSIGKLDALVGLAETVDCRAHPTAGLFRRRGDRHALRQLRQLPLAAESLERQRRRAEAVVLCLSHRAEIRRHASGGRAGRSPHRQGQAIRP